MKTKKIDSTDAEAGLLIGFITLTLFIIVLTSCSRDDDKAPDTRSLFVGTYSVEDISTSTGYVYNYDVTISNGVDGELEISNFANLFNVPVKATVKGTTLNIQSQSVTNSGGKTIVVSGIGSIINNVLTFSYTTINATLNGNTLTFDNTRESGGDLFEYSCKALKQ